MTDETEETEQEEEALPPGRLRDTRVVMYGRERGGNVVRRATTSKVFGILLLSFIINATSKYKNTKKTDAGNFFTAMMTANLPAWGILLIIMTFLADNPTTGQMAYGLAILIMLGSVLVNGEKAAKNIGHITENWGSK